MELVDGVIRRGLSNMPKRFTLNSRPVKGTSALPKDLKPISGPEGITMPKLPTAETDMSGRIDVAQLSPARLGPGSSRQDAGPAGTAGPSGPSATEGTRGGWGAGPAGPPPPEALHAPGNPQPAGPAHTQLANVDIQSSLQKQQKTLQSKSKALGDTSTAVIRKVSG
jgi:hypothetical protein